MASKYILTGLLASLALFTQAQMGGQGNNVLLDQAFWKNKPTVEIVKTTIEKGNDPAQLNEIAMDPVTLAINNEAPTETILFLLQQKGNTIDKLTHDARTYLFWAANKGNIEIMEYLIAKGAKVNIQDSHGYSVMTFAAVLSQLNTKVYDLCIQQGANIKTDVNRDGANALLLAIGADTDFKLTEYFISKGLDLKSKDAAGNNAFDYAARGGNIPAMKILISKGIAHIDNALLMASMGSHRKAVPLEAYQYLESLGLKPTVLAKNGDNVLHAIVRRPGQTEVVKYFLSKGVKANQVNEEGNTPFLNAAAFTRDTATLALLLPSAKELNRANKAGATALTLAVKSNSAEVVQYLLNKGADINVTDAKGNSLVYYLFESYGPRTGKDFELKLKALQAKGLNLATPQKDGSTVYHLAVSKNDLGLVKLVQPFGADVNAKSKDGLTALHKAAMLSKDDTIMQYLIAIGAKKEATTNFNETAYQLANENEYLSKQKISVDFLK